MNNEENREQQNNKLIRCCELDSDANRFIYAVAYQGTDHIRHNIPCQDYCGFKLLNNGISVLAISDGHGSAKLSEHGSRFAVESLFHVVEDCIKNGFTELDIVRYFRDKIGRDAIITEWKNRIAQDWTTRNTDPQISACTDEIIDMYGATLIFCIALHNFLLAGFIGDGALILVDNKAENIEVLLSAVDDVGESTCSLSHQRSDFFNIKLLNRNDFKYVLMSTDGIAKPYGEAIFDIAKNCAKQHMTQPTELKNSIDDFMKQSHPSIGDDISLVFGALGDSHVTKQL